MTFDLVAAIEDTAAAAIAIAVIAVSVADTPGRRIRVAAGLGAWFAVVVVLGASRVLSADAGLGAPGLGLAIVLPIATIFGLILGTASGRAALADVPLPAMIGVNAIRTLGVTFVLLHSAGRLPAPFAPVAGWGDIAIGMTAPFVAWAAAHDRMASRWIVLGWNTLGLLDLLVAISLGVTSSPGPLRLFVGEPSSAIMTDLPWLLTPGFLVPLLLLTHLVVFARLTRPRQRVAVA